MVCYKVKWKIFLSFSLYYTFCHRYFLVSINDDISYHEFLNRSDKYFYGVNGEKLKYTSYYIFIIANIPI